MLIFEYRNKKKKKKRKKGGKNSLNNESKLFYFCYRLFNDFSKCKIMKFSFSAN